MIDLQKKYSWVSKQDYEIVAGNSWPTYEIFCQHNNVDQLVYQEIDTMLAQPAVFDHPSFCILPFYGKELPNDIACCLMAAHNINEVRKEMLAGIRPTACQKCWTLEDRGQTSDRQLKNSFLDSYQNKNIHQIYQECLDGNYEVLHYKIDTSNTCNATCITCNDLSSSSWGKLKQKNGLAHRKEWTITAQNLEDKINYKTAQAISFRGGEPFLSDSNFQILEKLIDNNNTGCFISFVTNGSFKLSKRHKQILKCFSKVNFCFSIDGTDSVFDYIRYPLNFEQIKENIALCWQNNIAPSVSYTLSNINILYHSRTVDWFNKQKLPYLVNPVYNPLCFAPDALPTAIKQYIHQNYNHPEIEKYLLTHSNNNDTEFSACMQELQKQDSWKNIRIGDYLPELSTLFEQHAK